jgi:TonB family protein
MAEATKSRVLKVGLFRAGKPVRELQLRPRAEMTVGTDAANTLTAGDAKFAKRHVLLSPAGDAYDLHLLPGMMGKIYLDDREIDAETAGKDKGASKKGNETILRLTPNAKGRIVLGDDAILFQLLAPGSAVIAGKLPPELRGGLIQTMDKRFATVLAVSFLLHILIFLYTNTIPPKDDFEFVVQPVPAVSEVQVYEPEMQPEKKDEGEGEKGPGKKGEGPKAKPGPPAPESRGLLALITKQGKNGALQQVLSDGLGDDINAELAKVGGVQVARSGDLASLKGGPGGGGRSMDLGDLGRFGTDGTRDLEGKGIRKVKTTITDESPDVSGKLDRNIIAATVRKYLAGIKACYEYQLKRDPNLKGKITVRFTIGIDGNVEAVSILSSSLEDELVKACVKRRIQRWVFPKPEEGTVTVVYPFIFTAVTGG